MLDPRSLSLFMNRVDDINFFLAGSSYLPLFQKIQINLIKIKLFSSLMLKKLRKLVVEIVKFVKNSLFKLKIISAKNSSISVQ